MSSIFSITVPSRKPTYHIPQKWHFEDDFPFPKVGYVNPLEGTVSPSTTFFHLWRRYPGFSVPWLGSMAAKGLRVILPTAPKGHQPWGPLETTWHQSLGTQIHAWNLEVVCFFGGDGWVGGWWLCFKIIVVVVVVSFVVALWRVPAWGTWSWTVMMHQSVSRKHSNRKATVFAICTIASGFGDEDGNEWMMMFDLFFAAGTWWFVWSIKT